MKKLLLFTAFVFASFLTQAQDINMQDGTFNRCSGTFYDSGGAAGPYANGESFVLTICDDGSGGILQLDFISFTTETPNDVLTIYDGPDTTAPVLGDFSGTNSPGLVRPSPSNASGCLTFEFVSNEFFSSTGWEAIISCCQMITSTFDGSTPAAVGGIIEADVDELITFNASAIFDDSDVGATYNWDFGDGTTAMGTTVMHSYPSPGMYPVSFVAIDAAGCASQNRIELIADVNFDTAIGNPFVDAGPDVDLDCAAGEVCADLTADFLSIGETTTYEVIPIPFDPPFSFSGLANSLNPDIDDAWSVVEPLPFDFCFFGNPETQFQVGSNGVIRFDVDPSDTGNGWAFSEDLPNNSNPTLGEANIFTPGHDIDPSQSETEEIGYEVLGTAPNRVLVVSYYEVPLFSGVCNDLLATQMAVLYETTNIVDIYILNKPTCETWNSGNAVVGIQNDAGTEAFVPPGRNTSNSPWTTDFEAWRFIPRGDDVTTITWFDESGAVVGDTATINVCPSGTETYTARVDYLNCNGEIISVEDTVTVTTNATFSFDLGPDINQCTDDPVTLDADAGAADVTYQWFLDGMAITGATDPTYDADTSGDYSVEVTDGECFVEDTITVTFFGEPIANEPLDFVVCDDDNDGFFEFDLTEADAAIIAGQPDTFVNYYESLEDALAGDTAVALASPYTNTSSPQTIWARIENSGGCFDTVTFTLTVNNSPEINPVILSYQLCDDDTPDNSTTFDLTSWLPEITSETTSTCLFYLTEDDANNATDPIMTPESFVNTSDPQQIWVRCDNSLDCFSIGSFTLVVNDNPITAEPEVYELCDELPFDGFTEFDLESRNDEITAGAAGVTLTYHETEDDAQAGVGALSSPYTNTSNPQTVYARVENDATGCFSVQSLDLLVVETPEAFVPTPLEECDEDEDEVASFNLTLADTEITGGAAGVIVSYHLTLDDANNNVDPLVSPYDNVSNPQNVFARVSDSDLGECFAVVELTLIVNPGPSIADPDPITDCDDDSDGFISFDLTEREDQILNGLPAADYQIEYFEDAAFSIGILDPTAYINISNPQTIYIVVTELITGCTSTTELIIEVLPNPVINTPDPYELCDDNSDGVVAFDLESQNAAITGGTAGVTVSYHLTPEDAEDNLAALSSPYSNISNPQTVYVRVEDSDTGCFSTTSLELVVLSLPVATTPTDVTLCGNGDDNATFDLDPIAAEALGGQSGINVTFHESEEDADNGDNPVSSPYSNNENPQTLYLRLQDQVSGCYSTTSVLLNVEFVASLTPPADQESCPASGAIGLTNPFDLTLGEDGLGIDLSGLTVSYHTSSIDAEDGTNAIANPSAYTNTTETETIYVRVSTANGCANITSFEITVVECDLIIPEGISPNGDGSNDTFRISGIDQHPNFELQIFDRRGLLVYSGNGSTQDWDGRALESGGGLLPTGTYFYTLKLNDDPNSAAADIEQLYTGFVYLNY